MSTTIEINLDLAPVACPRPRVSKNGVFYPKKYNTFREKSKALLMNQCKMFIPKQQKLHIQYKFVSRRQTNNCKGAGRQFKQTRPDLDNYIKAINDSLQSAGIIEDDSQIVMITAQKLFGDYKESGCIELQIKFI